MPDEAHDRIVTSGDVTRALIASRRPPHLLHRLAERDLPLINGLDVELVGTDAAETVVCSGFFDDETETPADYRATAVGPCGAQGALHLREPGISWSSVATG